MESYWELGVARDDLYLEYIALLNTIQQYEKALQLLEERTFHPWEGGEGRVTQQYVFALVEQGKQYLLTQQSQKASAAFQNALMYPENLGEGKLAGAQENNIYYYSGCAYASQGLVEKALECFQTASSGLEEPSNAFFYNDQPPDMIFYQGLASLQLHHHNATPIRFQKLTNS